MSWPELLGIPQLSLNLQLILLFIDFILIGLCIWLARYAKTTPMLVFTLILGFWGTSFLIASINQMVELFFITMPMMAFAFLLSAAFLAAGLVSLIINLCKLNKRRTLAWFVFCLLTIYNTALSAFVMSDILDKFNKYELPEENDSGTLNDQR